MGLLREKALRSAGIVTLIVGLLVSPLSLQAQDSPGPLPPRRQTSRSGNWPGI